MKQPKLPPKEKWCDNCGRVNIYRTVCQNCSKDLYNFDQPHEVNNESQSEAQFQDNSMVSSGFPDRFILQRNRQLIERIPMKTILMALVAAVGFFCLLALVHDPIPEPPRVVFSADTPTLQCPIAGACSNLANK